MRKNKFPKFISLILFSVSQACNQSKQTQEKENKQKQKAA